MREKILIVEDDPTMRLTLSQLLSEEGFEVVAVALGLEAVQAAMETEFDLIITDIRMAGMDGLETLSKVKERQPSIGSMVVTGYSTEEDSVRAVRLHVGEYLRKPFQLDVFLDSVQRLIEQRRQDLKLVAKEAALRKIASWSLEKLAHYHQGELETPDPSWVGLARQARLAGYRLGFSEEQCSHLQLVLLLALLRRHRPQLDLQPILEALPHSARNWLEELEEGEGGEKSRALQILSATLSGSGPELQLEVAQALQHAAAADTKLVRSPDGSCIRQRNLLTLAQSLESSQDISGAQQLFQKVVELAPANRESLEAQLGLARLARRQQKRETLVQLVRQLPELARSLSPLTQAQTCLQLGILVPSAEAPPLLDSAERLFEQLGAPEWRALTRLARVAAGESPPGGEVSESLQLLLQPEHLPTLLWGAPWLLPLLLGRQLPPDSPGWRTLRRLVRHSPSVLSRLLEEGGLNPSQRLQLVDLLRQAGGSGSPRLLQRLQSDPEETVRLAAAAPGPPSPAGSAPPPLRLLVFGTPRVFVGDEEVPDSAWRNKKAKTLLIFLASQGRVVPEDVIVEEFWPNDPSKGKANITAALSYSRRALRPSDWNGELDYIVRASTGLQLNPELRIEQDLDEFQRLLGEGDRESDPRKAMELRRRACRLYSRPYAEGYYSDWALAIRSRCEEQLTHHLQQLAEYCLHHQAPLEAVEYAQRLLEQDPCNQLACQVGMQAHQALGRPEQALRMFDMCARNLKLELAMEPSIALLECQQRALLGLTSSPR